MAWHTGCARSPLHMSPPLPHVTLKLKVTGPFTAMYGCVSAFRCFLVGLLPFGYILTVHGLSYGDRQQRHIIIGISAKKKKRETIYHSAQFCLFLFKNNTL